MLGFIGKRLPNLNARERNQLRNDLSDPLYVKRSEIWRRFHRGEVTKQERDEMINGIKDE